VNSFGELTFGLEGTFPSPPRIDPPLIDISVRWTFYNHSVTTGSDWLVSRGVEGSSGVESLSDSSSDNISSTDGRSSLDI
jgi:hypothetical protein